MGKKICFITTVSMTINQFIRFSFETFHNDGYEIHVIADMDEQYVNNLPSYVHAHPIKMERGVKIKDFFRVVSEMKKIFKKEKFDIVQYSTPNASLYASIASWLSGIKIRLYCQWGLVYQGFTGIKKLFFKTIERLVCLLSTDVQPDSHGNLELCRKEHFYSKKKSRVVWNGSANGISLDKFQIERKLEYRQALREKYGISDDTFVLGYVGRVGKEKGFDELMQMTKILHDKYENFILLYVGPNEKPDTVAKENLEYFDNNSRIIYTGGWVDNTECYYSAMDVFVFPTYREGFGSVTIEAEAMGIPVVVSDVPGPQNAIIDGVTGYKLPSKTVEPWVDKISYLIENPDVRGLMGIEGRKFVEENFDDRILLQKILENRNQLLERVKK